MKKITLKSIFVSAFLVSITQNVFSQEPNKYKIGVAYGSSLFSHRERFEFSLNGNMIQTAVLDSAHLTAYFPQQLDSGQHYTIAQISGPRTCNLLSQNQGVVSNSDILISVGCGHPPLTLFKINVVGVDSGETFLFSDSHGRGPAQFRSPVTFNWGGFPQGDYYLIKQTGGPRQCIMTNNEGIVGENSITILADCRKPFIPPAAPSNTYDLVSRSTDNKTLSSYYESWAPVISGENEDDGRYVAFTMYGKGIDGSSGKYRQVFWRDRKKGITKLVSKTPTGEEGNGNSFSPSISANGRSVVFETYATNLTGNDNNGVRDVCLWEETTGKITLVSKSDIGITGNGESYEPVISGDGNTIAYTSNANNIVQLEPVYSTPNVYVYDVRGGHTTFITKDYETGKAAGGYAPTISDDGSKIAFCAYTNRLVKNDNNNLWDIFLWEKGAGGLKRISVPAPGVERDQGTESSSRVVWPSISGDGGSIVFATTSTTLAGGDTNGMQDIFLYNTLTEQIKKVSSRDNTIEGDGDSPISQGERIGISYDGNWVTYNTNTTNFGVPKGNIVLQNTITGKIIPVTSVTNIGTARPMLSRHGYFVVAGCNQSFDKRFSSTGIFTFYRNITQ